MKKFIEELLVIKNKTELDLEYPYYEDGESNECTTIPEGLNLTEVPSIDIDELVKILDELKGEGANRVYINTHNDHCGYYFYGVKLYQAVQAES